MSPKYMLRRLFFISSHQSSLQNALLLIFYIFPVQSNQRERVLYGIIII